MHEMSRGVVCPKQGCCCTSRCANLDCYRYAPRSLSRQLPPIVNWTVGTRQTVQPFVRAYSVGTLILGRGVDVHRGAERPAWAGSCCEGLSSEKQEAWSACRRGKKRTREPSCIV